MSWSAEATTGRDSAGISAVRPSARLLSSGPPTMLSREIVISIAGNRASTA
jgi:hypothetical protein